MTVCSDCNEPYWREVIKGLGTPPIMLYGCQCRKNGVYSNLKEHILKEEDWGKGKDYFDKLLKNLVEAQ